MPASGNDESTNLAGQSDTKFVCRAAGSVPLTTNKTLKRKADPQAWVDPLAKAKSARRCFAKSQEGASLQTITCEVIAALRVQFDSRS